MALLLAAILLSVAPSCDAQVVDTSAQRRLDFPAVLEVSTLDATSGIVLNRGNPGPSVAGLGDVNGDGIDDIAFGARDERPSQVIFGQPNIGFFQRGFGISPPPSSRGSIYGGGDFTGDGFNDLIVDQADDLTVIFGEDGIASDGSFNINTELNGNGGNGVRFRRPNGVVILAAAFGGDVNDDGADDILVAVRDNDGGRTGVFVVYSFTNEFELDIDRVDGTNGLFVEAPQFIGDEFGTTLSALGDVNNDGCDDIIIGASRADGLNGEIDVGACYVLFGCTVDVANGYVSASSLDGTNGFVIYGADEGDEIGYSVSAAGDVNGDGIHDVIVGGRPQPLPELRAFVTFGAAQIASTGVFELADLDGVNGFALLDTSSFTEFPGGAYVSSAGDVNDDGFDDLILGCGRSVLGDDSAQHRRFYVVFGGSDVTDTDLSSLDGATGFIIPYAQFGVTIVSILDASPAGDVNSDGVADFILGWFGSARTGGAAGEVYVIFGSPRTTPVPTPRPSFATPTAEPAPAPTFFKLEDPTVKDDVFYEYAFTSQQLTAYISTDLCRFNEPIGQPCSTCKFRVGGNKANSDRNIIHFEVKDYLRFLAQVFDRVLGNNFNFGVAESEGDLEYVAEPISIDCVGTTCNATVGDWIFTVTASGSGDPSGAMSTWAAFLVDFLAASNQFLDEFCPIFDLNVQTIQGVYYADEGSFIFGDPPQQTFGTARELFDASLSSNGCQETRVGTITGRVPTNKIRLQNPTTITLGNERVSGAQKWACDTEEGAALSFDVLKGMAEKGYVDVSFNN